MPRFNLKTRTLGGRQWWGDVAWFRGYRIQEHLVFGHYRLLDPKDVRHAWGSLLECRQRLQELKQERGLEPLSGRAVILAHGIFRSSKCFHRMATAMKARGYQVIGFDYPSTRVPLAKSAEYLRQLLDSLHGLDEIDLVVHSLGGLVVRTYLQLQGEEGADPRLRRLVMLGVPNQGARLANLFSRLTLYRWLYGPPGQQLVEGDQCFISSLPTPPFEFAIIAGGRGTARGWNPLIPGDDDGTVSVAATRLPGASDFLVVKSMHTPMLRSPEVIEATCRYFETGAFRENGVCEPVTAPQLLMAESALSEVGQ